MGERSPHSRQVGLPRTAGRTRVPLLHSTAHAYELEYEKQFRVT